MPCIGLCSEDRSVQKTGSEIRTDLASSDPRALRWSAPASPSIVRYLADTASLRLDVGDEVTASQLSDGIRQLFLEARVGYFVTISSEIASMQGTKTHNLINRDQDRVFIAETRLFYDKGGTRIASARNDTFHVPTGLLEDLKNIKWYAVKLMLERGPLAAHPGSVYQLNLFRILMGMRSNRELLFSKYPWLIETAAATDPLTVRRMQLLCTPPNMDDPNRKEASKIIDTHTHIPITVPFLDDGEVLRAYEQKYSAKHRALETTTPRCARPSSAGKSRQASLPSARTSVPFWSTAAR